MGEAMHAGAEGTWEISVPSLRFCCEPKTVLKSNFLQINKLENTTAVVVGWENVERGSQSPPFLETPPHPAILVPLTCLLKNSPVRYECTLKNIPKSVGKNDLTCS